MSRSSLSLLGFFFSVSNRRRCVAFGQLFRMESTSTWPPLQPQNPSPRVLAIVDEVAGLSLLELADLTETLRARLRVDQMPGVTVMTPGMPIGGLARGKAGASGAAADAKEEKVEKSSFDLKLDSFDAAAKIKIIKEVRSFTDLGLKEAKDLVEKAPAVIKKGVPKEEAEKIVQKMKEVGAKVIME